eukprot:gb/GFBE01007756.1/.p1 GENE.gb/GFBE01007756.1/~~gb/GFBE01007756.1/.p1  ORF type:complete len:743 (+),score=196.10 gb/GFBE01007756.1/:1-2229(+)
MDDDEESQHEEDIVRPQGYLSEDAPEDFWDAFEFEDEAYDDDGEYWDDDYDEDEEEEEEDDDDDETLAMEERGDKHAAAVFEDDLSVSTVSNETQISEEDEDVPDLERATAQILPEPPWKKSMSRFKKMLLSCLLPFLLVALLLYALFKGVKITFQVLFDIYIVSRYCVLLCIRIALFPFYLIWKLLLPEFIQSFIAEKFEARVGRRIRAVLAVKKAVEDAIMDIPDVLWACTVAVFETCAIPIWTSCSALGWMFFGQYFFKHVLEPWHNAKINQVVQGKKRFAQGADNDKKDPAAASQAEIAARRLKKAKVKARREKAKRLRQRRKMQDLQVSLKLPSDAKGGKNPQGEVKVQLEDQDAAQLKTRIMVVERRYALGVGFAWGCAGLTLLVLTLDGAKEEMCTICDEVVELNIRMCRHGKGQDCAFEYHMSEVVIAVCLMGIGLLILIYATFLYRPAGLGDIIAAREEEEERKKQEAKLARLKKAEDAEMQILNLIEEHHAFMTVPKRIKQIYYSSPLGLLQHHVDRCALRFLKRVLKFEHRHRLKQRSIITQDALIFIAYGWASWVYKKVNRCVTYMKNKRKKAKKAMAGRSTLERTSLGRCILKIWKPISNAYVVRAFLFWTGLQQAPRTDESEARTVGKVVSAGKRVASGEKRGATTLEETMSKFGFYTDLEAQGDAQEETTVLKGGYEEICIEAGLDGVDEEVMEEDPIFLAEDKIFQPQPENEELADDLGDIEHHIG